MHLINYRYLSLLVLLFITKEMNGQSGTEICNPVNLSYRFQPAAPSRREAADPTVIVFKGKYFMFASKSGGYWSSSDLISWKFITTKDLPLEDYAPTAVVINDSVYFMALDRKIYRSGDPSTGQWEVVASDFPYFAGDPALFLDDDGRLYLYHGLSNFKPIYGVELDRSTFSPIGEQVECLGTNSNDLGWERRGDYNTDKGRPFLEGAWMTKYNGQYYLQYSAPGTQYKSYSDGVYVSANPLGPFKLADHNPFSYKPEGFINGAGHGSTFLDKWGNYWRAITMTISVKQRFERRIGFFPAFFNKDGTFYTYTGFGDFPHVVPQKKMSGPSDFVPSAMLLSYKKGVEVSSSLVENTHVNLVDEDIRTSWSAATGKKGEWLIIDLGDDFKISAIQINFADESTSVLGRSDSIYHQYLVEYSADKKNWKVLADKRLNRTDVPHDFLRLNTPITARYVRLTNYHVPDGKFAISDLRVFGSGEASAPPVVSSFTVVRDTIDACNISLNWPKVPGAIGYNIRYGKRPGELYHNYQVLDKSSLSIHSLNALETYYFTIDSFNERGITEGKLIKQAIGKKKN